MYSLKRKIRPRVFAAALTALGLALAPVLPAQAATTSSPVDPDSCTGMLHATKSITDGTHGAREDLWWTRNSDGTICIGTVNLTESYVVATGRLLRVRIWSSGGVELDEGFSDGTIENGHIFFSHPFKRSYNRASVNV